jgi:ABC-2 type transport system permease protein
VSGGSLSRLWILIRRERTELLRDRISLAIIVALPLVTLVLFTFALATDVKNMPLAVFDAADSPRSRALIQAIQSTGYFELHRATSLQTAGARLASGEIAAILVIPPDVDERFNKGEIAEAQLLLDGAQQILAANAEAIIRATAAAFDARARSGSGGRGSFIEPDRSGGGTGEWPAGRPRVETRPVYNPRLDSEHYMIPGLLGYIFTFLTILVAAVSIVRERMIGTFEQLLITPVTAGEIIAAKLVVLGIAMLADEVIVMLLGGVWFHVWPRGSIALLFGATTLYLVVTLSIGLLISAGSKTPDEAIQKALVTATPLLNVSGLVFSVASMPYGFQVLAKVLPVYHYLQVTRSVYLAGAGPGEIASHLAVIAAYLVLLGLLLVRKLGKARQA